MEIKILLEDIENCRKKIGHLALNSSLSSLKVVTASQQLDQLLNRYNSLVSKK